MREAVDLAISKIDRETDDSLSKVMNDCADFLSVDQQKIIDFYSGATKSLSTGVIEDLITLSRRIKNMLNYMDIISDDIDNGAYWEILDILEQIDTKLQQTKTAPRFLRSSITRTGSQRGTYRSYTLREGQSIESLLRDLSIAGADDIWKHVALENDLAEEDYGDLPARVDIRLSNISSEQIQDVFDIIQGNSVYGRDIDKSFVFEDDDLKVLSENKTVRQSVEILISIRKGDIPEFPSFGLSLIESIGVTASQFSFPIIVRQLSEVFARDDTLQDFNITDYRTDNGNIFIEFSITTLFGESVEQQFEIGDGSSPGQDPDPPPPLDPPIASFSGSPTEGEEPLEVEFSNESTGGAADSFSWDFGDGNSSTDENPTHVYDDEGTYSVSLTVTNEDGSDTETKTDYISVTAPAGPSLPDYKNDPDWNLFQDELGDEVTPNAFQGEIMNLATNQDTGLGSGDIVDDGTQYFFDLFFILEDVPEKVDPPLDIAIFDGELNEDYNDFDVGVIDVILEDQDGDAYLFQNGWYYVNFYNYIGRIDFFWEDRVLSHTDGNEAGWISDFETFVQNVQAGEAIKAKFDAGNIEGFRVYWKWKIKP